MLSRICLSPDNTTLVSDVPIGGKCFQDRKRAPEIDNQRPKIKEMSNKTLSVRNASDSGCQIATISDELNKFGKVDKHEKCAPHEICES